MDIKAIREKMAGIEVGNLYDMDGVRIGALTEVGDNGADQILSIVIVPEGECKECKGTGRQWLVSAPDTSFLCPRCKATGKLPPITVEQAIKRVME